MKKKQSHVISSQVHTVYITKKGKRLMRVFFSSQNTHTCVQYIVIYAVIKTKQGARTSSYCQYKQQCSTKQGIVNKDKIVLSKVYFVAICLKKSYYRQPNMLVLCTLGQKTQLGNNYITAFRIAGTVVAYVKISLCYPYFFQKYVFPQLIHKSFSYKCLVVFFVTYAQ